MLSDMCHRTSGTVTAEIRRILRLAAHQGSRHHPNKSWPTQSQYARWCNCSSQLLGKFARGESKSIGHTILDSLAVLTGVFPMATEKERLWRIKLANSWGRNVELQHKFPRVSDYILHRLAIKEALAMAATIESGNVDEPLHSLHQSGSRNQQRSLFWQLEQVGDHPSHDPQNGRCELDWDDRPDMLVVGAQNQTAH
jgi:hypothetical protein